MSKIIFKDTELPDIIELRNISQVYEDDNVVIKDLDFMIEDKPGQGQFVVLLGSSGCGKSHILRYIAGLQTPSFGRIRINGKAGANQDDTGFVFQQYSSFEWLTVLENVELPLKLKGVPKTERREKALAMIETVGLKGQENKYAKYPNLSGGQLQRLAIARSLVQNPKILLLDEPFGALDIKIRMEMQDLLIKIWEEFQLTVVMVTHDISEAIYLSDEILVMSPKEKGFVYHKVNPLPFHRTQEVKKSPVFKDLYTEVESVIINS